ncbi:unnamed protein product, partial [Ranitomeya imitator]
QTLGNLRKQWTESGVETSRATVHRRVQEMGYRCRIPQGGVQIHMQVEDGEIMCVKIKEEEIPADISLYGSSERNPPERRLRLQYSHGLKPEKEEERLNIVLVNTDPMIDGDSSYLDNKEEEIPIDFCPGLTIRYRS